MGAEVDHIVPSLPPNLAPDDSSFGRALGAILRYADPVTRARGRAYADEDRVVEVHPTDSGVRAVVLGTEAYGVVIERHEGHLSTRCDCPAATETTVWCKHIVAVAYALGGIGPNEPAEAVRDEPAMPRLVREHGTLPTRALAGRLGLYLGRAVPHPADGWRRLREWWRASANARGTSVFRHAVETVGEDVIRDLDALVAFVPPASPAPGTGYGRLYDRLARRAVELARRAPAHDVVGPLDARHPGVEIVWDSSTQCLTIRERAHPFLPWPDYLVVQVPLDDLARASTSGGGTLRELFLLRALLLAMIERSQPSLVELERELSRPSWARLLDHLVPANTPAPSGRTLHFVASGVHGTLVQVRALHRGLSKKGKPKWTRAPLEALARDGEAELVRRVARLVLSAPEARRGWIDVATPLGHELVLALAAVGSVLAHEPSADVEPPKLSIVAGALRMSLDVGEDGLVRPRFWIGEAELDAELFRRRHDSFRGALLTAVEDERVVSASIAPALERWVGTWLADERAIEFPPESLDAVTEKVAPLVAAGTVELPRATLGSELALELAAALRVEWRTDGTAVLELLVSVHPGAPLVDPGIGPNLYTFRSDGARHFVERDFAREDAVVEEAWLALQEHVTWEGKHGRTEDVAQTLRLVELLRTTSPVARVESKIGKPPTALDWTGLDRSLTVTREGHWFTVRGDLRLGDTTITLGEVLDAARLARAYVAVGDGKYLHVPEDVQAKLLGLATAAELAKKGEAGKTLVHDAFFDALVEAEKMFHRSEGVDLVAYAKALEDARKVHLAPTIEAGVLRPYQVQGAAWMLRLAEWAPGCILADDMGLGKTVQTAAVLLARRKLGPALVVAPASVTSNWIAELSRFVPSLKVKWLNQDRELAQRDLGPGDVVVVSYGLLARAALPEGTSFATMVLDEAQFLKNAVAQRSTVVRAIERRFTIALTGTPLENHLGDLWSLFDQVFPGLLGREADFRERFRRSIETGGGERKLAALSRLVAPFLLRRTRGEVLEELPPRVELTQLVELSADEAKRYAALRRACELEFGKRKKGETAAQTKIKILAALTRLRQLACDVSLVDAAWTARSSKLARLTELALTLAAEKNRLLVFSQFRELCLHAKDYLERAGLRVAFLAGDTPTLERKSVVDAFQRGEFDVFCISLMAGGTGLNLTKANYVVHLDPWWNPAVEEQATSRAHRMGQTEPVTVIRLVSKGTIEEGILELHAKKRELASAVLEGKGSAKVMTADELLALVRYGDDA
jgi:superfamily II DNA or RNA helicase